MENRPTAAVFIGIQASGKTTFYHRYFRPKNFEHINLDTLKTRHREKLCVSACLNAGKSFAVDNTNPTRADREKYLSAAKAHNYHTVGYYFRSSISESIARNEKRGETVPRTAIAHTSNTLELPAYAEGFDELWYVSIAADGEFKLEAWKADL